jgi:hypothetical protein
VRRSMPVRLAVILALVVPTLITTLAFEGVASAAGPALKCKSFTTNSFGLGTLSKCKGKSDTGGGGSITGTTTGGTITWVNGETTTFTATYTTPTKSKCAEIWGALTWAQIDLELTVTGGTDTSIPVGNVGLSTMCYDAPSNSLKLLKGKFEL